MPELKTVKVGDMLEMFSNVENVDYFLEEVKVIGITKTTVKTVSATDQHPRTDSWSRKTGRNNNKFMKRYGLYVASKTLQAVSQGAKFKKAYNMVLEKLKDSPKSREGVALASALEKISSRTLQRAVKQLETEGKIFYFKKGGSTYMRLTETPKKTNYKKSKMKSTTIALLRRVPLKDILGDAQRLIQTERDYEEIDSFFVQ